MPGAEPVRAAVRSYVDSFNVADKELFLSLFSETVRQIDPVGTEPNVGRDALAAFWDELHSAVRSIEFEVRDLIICGNEACLAFDITQWREDTVVRLRGVDVFEVDGTGKICLIKGYCDADHIDTKPR
jgi:steroid delta-isomerase